jgi:hypothetical protein
MERIFRAVACNSVNASKRLSCHLARSASGLFTSRKFRHGVHGGGKIRISTRRNRAQHGGTEQHRFRRRGSGDDETGRVGKHLSHQM